MVRRILRRKVDWIFVYVCVCGGEWLMRIESRAMLSTDLWDASTDSRFISDKGGKVRGRR